MKVNVKLLGFAEKGSPVEFVELQEGARIIDLLKELNLGDNCQYVVLLGGRTKRLDELLLDGSDVTILPPLVGG